MNKFKEYLEAVVKKTKGSFYVDEDGIYKIEDSNIDLFISDEDLKEYYKNKPDNVISFFKKILTSISPIAKIKGDITIGNTDVIISIGRNKIKWQIESSGHGDRVYLYVNNKLIDYKISDKIESFQQLAKFIKKHLNLKWNQLLKTLNK